MSINIIVNLICREVRMNPAKCALLVDDDEWVLEVLMMMLERLGYKVLGAKSGAEAISIYKENFSGIDIILLDLNLSDVRGGGVFKKARAINPDAKVILLTGYGGQQEVSELMDLGCRGVLQKPVTLGTLSETLSRCDQLRFMPSCETDQSILGSAN